MILFTVFALGLMVSFVVAKGLMQASEYAAEEVLKQDSSVEKSVAVEDAQEES